MSIIKNEKQIEQEAIDYIKKHEPDNGYFLAFSGGKDSIVLYDLAIKAKVKFKAIYNNTLVEPPELVKFIKEYYPDVETLYPKENFWKLVSKNGIPSFKRRFCCRHLKEIVKHDLKHRLVGVRAEESWKRAKRPRTDKYNDHFLYKPLLWWSSADIWDYIKLNRMPYCSLYDEGFARLGCIICPLRGKKQTELYVKKYPNYYKAFKHFAVKYYESKQQQFEAKGRTLEDYLQLMYGNLTKIHENRKAL